MKLFVLLICFTAYALAQELPSNFEYHRATGQVTGIPDFTLNVNVEAVAYDAERGNEFEALGAIVQPERGKYGLIFWNAKSSPQFSLINGITATITLDGQEYKFPKVVLGPKKQVGLLKIEQATIVIDGDLFWKLCAAKDVLVRVGKVAYNLDEDNILAFRYYASEIKKDLTRRNKKISP